jgi:hypothetical protein
MQFFAHVGITLGAAWVAQQAISSVKRSVSKMKPNYIIIGDNNKQTTETDSNFIKSGQSFFYQNFFSGRKQKRTPTTLVISQGTRVSLAPTAGLMERSVE